MGFLDKAKKLAEQAQSKLDKVQAHGRPVATPPQDTTTPPHGDPLADAPPQPLQEPDPLRDDSAPARPADDPNQPPRMTPGDPLAG